MALIFLKRVSKLSTKEPLAKQLQMIQLPNPSGSKEVYETLYSFVHHAVTPYFEYCSTASRALGAKSEDQQQMQDTDSKTGK